MNLTQLPSPGLKFWHTQEVWYGDQDKLSVYYRTSSTSSWILLATYTGNIPDWTLDSIPLPNPSADYSLCFEGNAKYGYGVCIDDVEISSPYPDTLHIQSSVVMNAQSVCFDALQYISVAGNSEIFMVQPGGSARFIAGQSIRFFPGTVVEPGGFLHGSITNSNIYCLQAGNSPDVLSGIERDHPHNQGISNPWILYPNPATGLIVLESKANEHDECTVEIINLRGEKMKSLSCQIKRKLFLQIQDLTDGVYLLRINHGNDFSAIRFIKTH
jgi:hypothetical protein